ncbi:MAG: cyclase family protein, partial [Nonomuraea sp.]|nr:cyclase family protein [Nonomuraea sp.]
MRILDLSAPVDATGFEPEPVVHDVLSAADGARHLSDRLREHLGVELDPAELPGGEFLTLDTLTLTTHTGTHVDAPAHYGSTAAYGRPRTIDELPLDWFLAPGLLLDLTAADGDTITAPDLERAMKAAGHRPDPGDIVLLDTGAARW